MVPEPSEAAIRAMRDANKYPDFPEDTLLRAAYAVDVPAIVKAEVERAFQTLFPDRLLYDAW